MYSSSPKQVSKNVLSSSYNQRYGQPLRLWLLLKLHPASLLVDDVDIALGSRFWALIAQGSISCQRTPKSLSSRLRGYEARASSLTSYVRSAGRQ